MGVVKWRGVNRETTHTKHMHTQLPTDPIPSPSPSPRLQAQLKLHPSIAFVYLWDPHWWISDNLLAISPLPLPCPCPCPLPLMSVPKIFHHKQSLILFPLLYFSFPPFSIVLELGVVVDKNAKQSHHYCFSLIDHSHQHETKASLVLQPITKRMEYFRPLSLSTYFERERER